MKLALHCNEKDMHHSIPSRAALLLSLVLSSACGGAELKPPSGPGAGEGTALPVATAPQGSAPRAASCAEPTLGPARKREAGIDAFLADRPREAVDLLTAAVKSDPRDRAAEAFRAASVAKLNETRARAAEGAPALRRVPLETIPLAQTTRQKVETAPGKVRLEKESETKNLITDSADWEPKNQLTPIARRRADTLPAGIPFKLGSEPLRVALVHADHVASIYEGTIVIAAEGKRMLAFDVKALTRSAPRPLEIPFAQLVGKTLLVELAYNGYAKESGGKTGYFAAFDAATGALAWVSDPLVANAGEAIVSGGSIITGYGFTAEPDFVFVLDLETGKTEQKIAVKSGPEAIRRKGDRVFIRAYDTDYVFKSTTGLPAPLPANLTAEATTAAAPPPPSAESRCWVRRATAAILAKDARGVEEAADQLEPLSADRQLRELLRTEAKKLSSGTRLDLQSAALVVAPAPPWQAASPGASAARPPAASPKLVKVSSRAASPTRDMNPAFEAAQPWFIAPIEQGKLPAGARADIPSTFGQEHLSAIIPDQRPGNTNRSILVYGGRYLALLEDGAAKRVLDLDAFRHPPKADPQWKEFAVQDVTYAQERDGVLYVCNGGGSYAKEVYGKKGFLSAIDATSGALLWRSAPLTCNATFAMTDDHIISGYGFTAEPDFVFLVRRSDGSAVQKVPVDSGPNTIQLDGRRVRVETYGHVIDLEFR